MSSFTRISALALTAVLPLQVGAQNATSRDMLEEIVVTSSRVPMPLREIGTSVSVITQEEISQLGFNSLYEILRTQPGVQVSNAGGAGGASSLRIRGEEGYRTMMLLDGIDISDTSSPQVSPRVEQLLSSGIQRVEILRGPQGLMYGADAGGVVNITTLAPEEGLAGELSGEGGRYGTRQFAGNIGGGNDVVDFNLSAADYQTDGFNARSDDITLRDDDGYENTTAHGRFGWNATDKLRLGLSIHSIDATNDYDECSDSNFDRTDNCRDDYNQQAWRVQGNYELGRFNHELFYSNSDTDREFYSDGVSTFKPEGSLERSGYLGSFAASDALKLVYGVDLENESMNDGSVDKDRNQQGYYLEYQGGFNDRFYVTTGIRSDDNDDFGTHTSYRVSGAYLIDFSGGELKLKTTYGTGFRAPSLYEAAYNAGPFAYPPAQGTELSEEKSEGFDVGMSWSNATGLYLETVYFDQTVNDEIYFDLVDYSGYLQSNGNTTSQGVELVGQLPLLKSVWLSSNYTYNTTETNSGANRIFRPKHLANLGLNWQPLADRLVLGLFIRVSRDAEGLSGEALDNYEVVDITASFALLDGLDIYGRVENLLDEDYQEVPTYNTSGAAAYAGLKYSF
ncbi:MAG: TonB-dependent receptor [Halioglobus sp.]